MAKIKVQLCDCMDCIMGRVNNFHQVEIEGEKITVKELLEKIPENLLPEKFLLIKSEDVGSGLVLRNQSYIKSVDEEILIQKDLLDITVTSGYDPNEVIEHPDQIKTQEVRKKGTIFKKITYENR